MQEVTIQFPSIILLVEYLFALTQCDAKRSYRMYTLQGKFTKEDIDLAISQYNASVFYHENKKG
jgi:hypothetical protein